MSRFGALAIAFAAIGAPSAPPAGVRPAPGNADDGRPAATTPSIQIQVVEPGGFHWQDAAVGSLAAIGFTLVAAGLVLATRRSDEGPSQAKPTTSIDQRRRE